MRNPKRKSESQQSMLSKKTGGKAPDIDVSTFRQALLDWYDRHRRVLPWRAAPGIQPDPYHVWLSEIMLQQTVVAAVIPYFQKFVDKWPTVHDLAEADQDEVMTNWAGLGYYARARNLHKCAEVVSGEYSGVFPDNQAELKKLPGIGDYTSAAITSIAFDKPATVIDGNVDRVIARYFAIVEPLPDSKPQIREFAGMLSEEHTDRPGDFAQAMMDLGATICTPKSPKCMLCPLQKGCKGYEKGIQQELPYKKKKAKKPYKYGYIYWIRDDKNRVLFEKRPERGLLGGMTGLPTGPWQEGKKALEHKDFGLKLEFSEKKSLKIHHSFTHFDLELKGQVADLKEKRGGFDEATHFWVDKKDIEKLGLPTLFKKFVNLMLHDGSVK